MMLSKKECWLLIVDDQLPGTEFANVDAAKKAAINTRSVRPGTRIRVARKVTLVTVTEISCNDPYADSIDALFNEKA